MKAGLQQQKAYKLVEFEQLSTERKLGKERRKDIEHSLDLIEKSAQHTKTYGIQ